MRRTVAMALHRDGSRDRDSAIDPSGSQLSYILKMTKGADELIPTNQVQTTKSHNLKRREFT